MSMNSNGGGIKLFLGLNFPLKIRKLRWITFRMMQVIEFQFILGLYRELKFMVI
jgi:hypothetical protein